MLLIIDCESQATHNIGRRIREHQVWAKIVPHTKTWEEIKALNPELIIISGGPDSVYDDGALLPDPLIFEQTDIPVLGICYGLHAMTQALGGKVAPAKAGEFGSTKIGIDGKASEFFHGFPPDITVHMSHGDHVAQLPQGAEVLARSENGHVAAMRYRNLMGVQFHPEMDSTQDGRVMLGNFLAMHDATRDWDHSRILENMVQTSYEQLQGRRGMLGMSGGVDSSSLAFFAHKYFPDQFVNMFVNNGLLRKNEPEEVQEACGRNGVPLVYVDASAKFLKALEGVVDPQEKRKIIGHVFIEVFEQEARKYGGISLLAQGTLYPDVIESERIKLHHNVGGLPEKMDLELFEPFRDMFKDEVRQYVGKPLGVPHEILYRHPFPGPGLAIRIVGQAVTADKLRMVREADAIVTEELHAAGWYYKVTQAVTALLGKAVGVMGDARAYQHMIATHIVKTLDFIDAEDAKVPYEVEARITSRIVNEVKGVCRVLHDKTQKPPATIEFE